MSLWDDRELGFTGMLMAGYTPDEAYAKIRTLYQQPGIVFGVDTLRLTKDGRAFLRDCADTWRAHGFPPPWEVAS